MRHGITCLALLGALGPAAPAAAQNFLGADVGIARPLGETAKFAGDGGSFELRWRHSNRGRAAFEFVLGYTQMGLEGEVQRTIARFDATVRQKNELAQKQGGAGNGFILAEYGTFDTYYGGVNFTFQMLQRRRIAPFVSLGGGAYNWRVPFGVKFFRVPFFGEQYAWDPVDDVALYQEVHPEENVDFTKHMTSGGLNAALGASVKLTRRIHLGVQARTYLIFSSGKGNRERKIDDQPYLDRLTFALFNAGLNYRF